MGIEAARERDPAVNETPATPTENPAIPRSLAETAADWIVRRDGGDLSPEEIRAFDAWRAEPAHRRAFERMEVLWGILDGEPAMSTEREAPRPAAESLERAPPQSALPSPRQRPHKRWAARGRSTAPRPRKHAIRTSAALAASLALVVLGTVQDWATWLQADYATAIGERKTVALEDGSTVELDSGSAIALDFSPARRGVRLLAGAAEFRVAPDRARPFTVAAAGGSATALGTVFAIRDSGKHAEIVVTEHRVRVAGQGRSHVVGEGQRADFAADRLGPVEPAGSGATAWTRGRLVVVDRPLGEVVSEIARYRHGYIGVTGPAATMRVSGVYDLDHPLAAIDSIERSLGLASFRLSSRLIVLHR